MAKKVYAVRKGRQTGIFDNWDDCKASVSGYANAEFTGFSNRSDAEAYLGMEKQATEKRKTKKGAYANVPKNILVAYVDGSYNKVKRVYGSGVALFYEDLSDEISEAGTDADMLEMWNVAGEVNAAMLAIQYGIKNDFEKIIIHYDYAGIEGWANGWKTNKIGTQRYKKFIDEARKKIKIEFVKVKAHSSNELNDLADRLAKKACGV